MIQVINVEYDGGIYSLVLDDLTEDGDPKERLVEMLRSVSQHLSCESPLIQKGGLSWSTLVEGISPDDFLTAGFDFIEYIPFPVHVQHNEVVAFRPDCEVEVPF